MSGPPPRRLPTALFTAAALVSFALNSVLTRLALGRGLIDAPGFTAVRLGTGALALALLVRLGAGAWSPLRWAGPALPLALLAYAAPFSLAYLRLGAATGSLALFGAVQLSMIGGGLALGERPPARTWLGLLIAAAGLAALALPSARRPDPLGLLLMILAGASWAAYSLLGKRASDPLAANARAFLWALPLALPLVAASDPAAWRGAGVALAATSGAVTSGLGYAAWYRALRGLTATQAAAVQLCVPVLASALAVALLGEAVDLRLLWSGALVLGGIGLVLAGRAAPPAPSGGAGSP